MISIASFVGWSFVYLLGGMAGAALLMALVLSPWMVRQWWLGRPAAQVVRAAERITREAAAGKEAER